MARTIISTETATSGGNSNALIPSPISTLQLTTAIQDAGFARTAVSQYDANNFVVATFGQDTGAYTMNACVFNVDNNGNISSSSSGSAPSSTPGGISTTIMGDAGGGLISCLSRHASSGSYVIGHYQASSNGTSTIENVNRYAPGDFTAGYPHPSQGVPFRVGSKTGTRYTCTVGYNNSNYARLGMWSNNSWAGGATLSTINPHCGSLGALQWHGDASDYAGVIYWWQNNTLGPYLGKVTGTGTPTSLDYTSTLIGETAEAWPYDMSCFAYVNPTNPSTANNRMFVFGKSGKGRILSKDTTNYSQQVFVNLPFDRSATATASRAIYKSGFSMFAAGRNLFCMPTSGGMCGFYELVHTYDAQQGLHYADFNLVDDTLLALTPDIYEPRRTVLNGGAIMRVAGNNNQFLVSVEGMRVSVYDISNTLDLSSYA